MDNEIQSDSDLTESKETDNKNTSKRGIRNTIKKMGPWPAMILGILTVVVSQNEELWGPRGFMLFSACIWYIVYVFSK